GISYGWDYVNYGGLGTSTTNWMGGSREIAIPADGLFPGTNAVTANVVAATNGTTTIGIYDNSSLNSGIGPLDFRIGILNLNAGPNGAYHIIPFANSMTYLVFNNHENLAQINVIGNDAGNDVISCGVSIENHVLDITGSKLAITGPVTGGQIIVDC